MLYETTAADAGYDYDLCSGYVDRAMYKDTRRGTNLEIALEVCDTRTTLNVLISVLQSA